MRKIDLNWLAVLSLAFALASPITQADVVYSDFADGVLEARASTATGPFDPGWPAVQGTTDWQGTVGEWFGSGPDGPSAYGLATLILPFQLPSLGAVSDPFLTADFQVMLNPNTGDANSTDIDLYALNRIDANPAILASDWYNGASTSPGDAVLIQESFLTPATPQGWDNMPNTFTDATGDANLLSFLNSAYAGGANAGDFVFIRLSYGSDTFATGSDNYNINLAEADRTGLGGGPLDEDPRIVFTAVPEPGALVLLGLGAVLIQVWRRGLFGRS